MKTPVPPPATAPLPLHWVGPLGLAGPEVTGEIPVPLATFETPLWPSVNRGARVTLQAGGIHAVVVDERMTRSVVLEAPDAETACRCWQHVCGARPELEAAAAQGSRFTRLLDVHAQVVANLLYLRFAFTTGDAAGHNMATLAAERLLGWLEQQHPELRYVSLSANYCTDKKVSAVNGILGRGRYVVAETTIPAQLCRRYLKTTPEAVVNLHIKKNLIGSLLAGSVRSANAHFANLLLAFYLATGQDGANVVEGSQGLTHAETRDGDLYFSVTLPNLIVGSVGAGKALPFVRAHLEQLGCLAPREPGANARRLAILAAATVLCGELSLLAALTNPHELMAAHCRWER